ncbi:unnamed protein product [Urochloa humidicola]
MVSTSASSPPGRNTGAPAMEDDDATRKIRCHQAPDHTEELYDPQKDMFTDPLSCPRIPAPKMKVCILGVTQHTRKIGICMGINVNDLWMGPKHADSNSRLVCR